MKNTHDLTHKSVIRLDQEPRISRITTRHWKDALSKRKWTTTLAILLCTLTASAACLGAVISQMNGSTAESIISLGFGVANPRMLLRLGPVDGSLGLAGSVLMANLPQLILSLVYFSLNALFTAMHLAHEYSGYQVQRKPLRVTTPRGQQRKTYWLQLPFIYGLPIIAISAILHWLISQGIFLVQFDVYEDGVVLRDPVSGVGLSPAPMLTIVIVGVLIFFAAVGMGYWRLKGRGMPVAGSCSFALTTAAHRPEDDVDAAFLCVKWGEVVKMGTDEVGHCCFTSQEVVEVVPGRLYSGIAGKTL
jgi:hypothetical protein